MDSPLADPLVNRDDPIPVVNITGPSGSPAPAKNEQRRPSKREALRHSLSADKLKEKLDTLTGAQKHGSSDKLQDRLLNMLLQQMIPDGQDDDEGTRPKDRRSRKYVDRPGFSLPVMSTNFRRFNARIGVVFVFQNRMIRLFSWKDPTHTLSFLAVYSFCCLDPHLLVVLPLALCLFFVMVPAFLARHPPPPTHSPTDHHAISGPAIAPPQNVKPAPELSKDFWRNMRDLQNCMEDFSRVHDAAIATLAPPTNFSNEALSSTIFLLLTLTTCVMFIAAQLLPWRAVFLVVGWVAVCSCHPKSQEFLHNTQADIMIQEQGIIAGSWLAEFAQADCDLSSAPEQREVEVFELQRRGSSNPDSEYEPWIFSVHPYTPLSPSRIAGDRPRGSRFFEDVEPPKGWKWGDKKWTLDLLSREWVEERCITGVEVEVEGERWVTDILYDDGSIPEEEHEATTTGYVINENGKSPTKGWEEASAGKKGEWRRRRWVRLVERKPVEVSRESNDIAISASEP
ncbi:Pex24p-domain-containing protein [Saccharata proteae CBS 121410]|uniref:Pex24p-domain-containing protein n=1 Tax=Saccharata proteae CBS 121410 TaxID=1314787 RepID=A0A9P4HSS1_9PEZI|nr:Pex24p-domain-containing protein [Saccharata proteae CBS 121410]